MIGKIKHFRRHNGVIPRYPSTKILKILLKVLYLLVRAGLWGGGGFIVFSCESFFGTVVYHWKYCRLGGHGPLDLPLTEQHCLKLHLCIGLSGDARGSCAGMQQ